MQVWLAVMRERGSGEDDVRVVRNRRVALAYVERFARQCGYEVRPDGIAAEDVTSAVDDETGQLESFCAGEDGPEARVTGPFEVL